MPTKTNPGTLFEGEIIRSLPTEAIGGRRVYHHKLADMPFAPTRPGRFRHRDGIQFTPKHPFDLEITAAYSGTEKMRSRHVPQLVMKLELKRTLAKIGKRGALAGKFHSTLGFSVVRRHQVSGLLKAAAAGQVAGILWLAEIPGQRAECYLVEIQEWCDYIAEQVGKTFPESCNDAAWSKYLAKADSKSMPLAVARARGIELAEDVGRGRERRYWKMRELMIHFGAAVEPTPRRKTRRVAAVKLFGQEEIF